MRGGGSGARGFRKGGLRTGVGGLWGAQWRLLRKMVTSVQVSGNKRK